MSDPERTAASMLPREELRRVENYNLRFRDLKTNEGPVDFVLGNLKQELTPDQKLDLLVFLAQHDEIFHDKGDIFLTGDEGERVGELVKQWLGENIVQE